VHRWEQDYKAAVKATKAAGKTKGKYGAIDVAAVLVHMRAHGDSGGTKPAESAHKPREELPTPKSGAGGPPKPPRSIRPVAGPPEDRYPDMPDGTPAPLRPSDVKPLAEDDVSYILDGDGMGGGGHRFQMRIPGKRVFPQAWDEDKLRAAVNAALYGPAPKTLSRTPNGVLLRSLVDNVVVWIPIRKYPDGWEVSTAYPRSGDGVYLNLPSGGRELKPLNLDDLTRTLDS
jgi:hypothetical protein